MVSTMDNGEHAGGGDESSVSKVKGHAPLHISTSHKGLINNENGCADSLSSRPKRLRFFNFGKLDSPSARFHRMAFEKEEVSRTVPSSSSLQIRERFHRMFSRKMDWDNLWRISKEWIRDPVNLALFVWIVIVAISGAILFMVMTGMLSHAIPRKSQRDTWFEVNNQILNALFTLMCLYQHPKRIYHFSLLIRWRPEDVLKLRKLYCENGTYKPHEWAHMMVVVALLNINCFAQYGLCGLNLGYRRADRPAIGVGICISVAIGAPAVAGVYSMLSPLGKDYETDEDEEAQIRITTEDSSRPEQSRRKSFLRRFSFALRDEERRIVNSPQWSGGILDIWDDISLAYLSLFCSFCVFGWNMERLGLGNMYVHIATFILFCMAPFWIFNLAAVNIDNENVRAALGVTGIFLCLFGLLYGGFWRIQMRKRFNLPSYNFCCNRPAVSDCVLWLCCCWCSLAQEVRTGNAYEIVEDKFCKRRDEESPIAPLPRSDPSYSSPPHGLKANSPSPSRFSHEQSPGRQLPFIDEEELDSNEDDTMKAPDPLTIRRETI